jgi:hypothetical protein
MYLPIKNIVFYITILLTFIFIIIGCALYNIYILITGVIIGVISLLICIFTKEDPIPDEIFSKTKIKTKTNTNTNTIINTKTIIDVEENNDSIMDIL